jgi:hypothetical protein
MVRRWSYINMLNDVRVSAFVNARQAAFNTTMNTSMYLRKLYTPSTTLVRRRWSRRRHLHNWLCNANILKDWARGYRFYRTYNSFVFNQHFTRTSFIAFNLISAKNSIPCLHAGSENVLTAVITKKILKYFNSATNTRLRFLSYLKYSSILLVSYDSSSSKFEDFSSHTSLVPLMPDAIGQTLPLEVATSTDSEQEVGLIENTFSLIFRATLLNIIYIYRISILLILSRFSSLNSVFSSKKNDF